MSETLYIKNDLEDYAKDISVDESTERASREQLIDELLPDSARYEIYSTGGWQGTLGIVIECDDYIWLIKEPFGSCGVCDGLLGASDKVGYGKKMLRNAYCFESTELAIRFLGEIDGWQWEEIEHGVREILEGWE